MEVIWGKANEEFAFLFERWCYKWEVDQPCSTHLISGHCSNTVLMENVYYPLLTWLKGNFNPNFLHVICSRICKNMWLKYPMNITQIHCNFHIIINRCSCNFQSVAALKMRKQIKNISYCSKVWFDPALRFYMFTLCFTWVSSGLWFLSTVRKQCRQTLLCFHHNLDQDTYVAEGEEINQWITPLKPGYSLTVTDLLTTVLNNVQDRSHNLKAHTSLNKQSRYILFKKVKGIAVCSFFAKSPKELLFEVCKCSLS